MSGQGIAQFIPLILIFVIFYFFNQTTAKKSKRSQSNGRSLKEGMKLSHLVA